MRKPDPQRIYLARRSATFRGTVDEHHLDELRAEHWIAAWEREAETRGIDRRTDAFWHAASAWIAEQRRSK
ncbi:MAG TPA: hypothetical protein VGK42_00140 [Candidatus Dormibacteraeota bacterium]|jgi:hypothetical protein